MKKRILALFLALVMTLTLPALAAENSTGNFQRSKTYAHQFSDVAAGSVFYDNIAALYEYGLSQGKANGTFGVKDSMTVGEIVIFASRIRSLYAVGDPEQGAQAYRSAGQRAWQPHLRYLQAQGVLGTELDAACAAGAAATRAQVAHVLANTLPTGVIPEKNEELVARAYTSGRYLTDVTDTTPWAQDILTLYNQGISVGSDSHGTFWPASAITRGAAAAMLTRLVDASLRLTPSWDLTSGHSAAGTTLGALIPAADYIAAPETSAQMDQAVRYMLSRNENTLTLKYASANAAFAQKIMEQALAVVKTYCEQSYNIVTCTYSAAGSITLTFGAASAGSRLSEYRSAAMDAAIAVHDQLWSNGTLRDGMSQYEIAKVYYTWICQHCVYDYSAGDNSLSHIAYSLFHNGTAVCDGYTGAYNLLLKLEGISCTALNNSSHIWTVATLDGVTYHIDTTWGDSGNTISYAYFAMTPSQSWAQHSW